MRQLHSEVVCAARPAAGSTHACRAPRGHSEVEHVILNEVIRKIDGAVSQET
jgi:hypothetical protein